MPNVSPQTKDSYLCVAKELTENDPKFITQFVPHSHKEVAHHILVYACEVPGVVSESGVW
jgi:peptidylglycine monooxygenase